MRCRGPAGRDRRLWRTGGPVQRRTVTPAAGTAPRRADHCAGRSHRNRHPARRRRQRPRPPLHPAAEQQPAAAATGRPVCVQDRTGPGPGQQPRCRRHPPERCRPGQGNPDRPRSAAGCRQRQPECQRQPRRRFCAAVCGGPGVRPTPAGDAGPRGSGGHRQPLAAGRRGAGLGQRPLGAAAADAQCPAHGGRQFHPEPATGQQHPDQRADRPVGPNPEQRAPGADPQGQQQRCWPVAARPGGSDQRADSPGHRTAQNPERPQDRARGTGRRRQRQRRLPTRLHRPRQH